MSGKTTTIYGHDVALETAGPGEIVTDVMVLTRVVRHNDETGKLEDTLFINTTTQTTGMVQRGMLYEALDAFVSTVPED